MKYLLILILMLFTLPIYANTTLTFDSDDQVTAINAASETLKNVTSITIGTEKPIVLVSSPTWYIDNAGGSDTSLGTSADAAWKTFNNLSRVKPGDFVAFKRGGIWRGRTLMLKSGTEDKPVIYGAYGEGADPKITIMKPVPTWKQEANNEWSYQPPHFTGEILLVKNGKRLAGTRESSTRTPSPTKGSLKEGEWDYVSAEGRVYYRDFGSSNPKNVEIVTGQKRSIQVHGVSDIVIQDLEFYGSTSQVFRIGENSTRITVRNCKVHSGTRGLEMFNATHITIEGNTVWDIDWKGIATYKATENILITGNHVRDIGKLSTDDSDWEGILVGGGIHQLPRPKNVQITRNTIENIGQDMYPHKPGGGSVRDMNSAGIVIDAASNILAEGNIVRNTWRKGIIVIASTTEGHNITVRGNHISNVGHMTELNWIIGGIYVSSGNGFPLSDILIEDNVLSDLNLATIDSRKRPVIGGGFVIVTNKRSDLDHVSNLVFRRNSIQVNSGYLLKTKLAANTLGMTNVKLDHNTYATKDTGVAVNWLGKEYSVDKVFGNQAGFYSFDTKQDINSKMK